MKEELKKVLVIVLAIITVIALLSTIMGISGIVMFTIDLFKQLPNGYASNLLEFLSLTIISGIVAFVLFYFGIGELTKCKKCNGKFCFKKSNSRLKNQEAISIKTEVNNYNSMKEVIGTSETYIPGTRNTYEIEYVCKKCGNKKYKYKTKDYKNT